MIFVCLITCLFGLGYVQPQLYDHTQEQLNVEQIEYKSRDNAFFSTHYAYYSLSDIGNMIPISLNSMSTNITSFNYHGYSGSYVINNVGTYYIDTSMMNTAAIYLLNTTTHRLELATGIENFGASFSTIDVDYHYRWSFSWNDSVGNRGIHIDSIYSIDTFVGQQQYSWSSYLSPVNNQTYDYSKVYIMFDLNSWGNYFTYPDSDSAYSIAYGNGYDYGYSVGKDKGYTEGLADSYDTGYDAGFQTGYTSGYNEGASQDATALTIMNGILEVGLLPVNVFLQMFNYEVFGINISGLISGLLTIAMTMIIIRFLFGGKENGK